MAGCSHLQPVQAAPLAGRVLTPRRASEKARRAVVKNRRWEMHLHVPTVQWSLDRLPRSVPRYTRVTSPAAGVPNAIVHAQPVWLLFVPVTSFNLLISTSISLYHKKKYLVREMDESKDSTFLPVGPLAVPDVRGNLALISNDQGKKENMTISCRELQDEVCCGQITVHHFRVLTPAAFARFSV